MAFPWKKVKKNRISKLVNDHLQNSQRRRDGSSLVVETGFATSLVDLFIKNREKLKKPSRKKLQSLPAKSLGCRKTFPASEPPSPPTNTPLSCPSSPLRSPLILPSPSNDVVRNKNFDEDVSEGYPKKVNGVLPFVLTFFLVVVLALGSKISALGITIAACLLFFLDYARRRASSSVKAKTLMLRFGRLLRSEDKPKKTTSDVLATMIEEDDSLVPCLMISESRHDHIREIQLVKAADAIANCRKFLYIEQRKILQEDSLFEALEVNKVKQSRRAAAIKSKMKKFFTSKFRPSGKAQDVEKDAAAKEEDVSIRAQVEDASRFSTCSTTQKEDKNRAFEGARENTALLLNVEEGSSPPKAHHGRSSRYLLAIICPIILIGLVQNRVTAFVLSSSCCLLLKLCS